MRFPSELIPGALWAIHPSALQGVIADALRQHETPAVVDVVGEETSESEQRTPSPAMSLPGAERVGGSYVAARVGTVAIVPVTGVLRPRAVRSWFRTITDGALNVIAHDLDLVASDRGVDSIVLAVDSPGGQVTGVDELADLIRRIDAEKPVHAHVSGWGASGGFWLPCAARRLTLTRTSEVGSIGVLTTYFDFSKFDERIGIEEIKVISTQSPLKQADPKTKAGFEAIQARMDALAEIFIADVARGRGVDVDTVRTQFGQGDLVIAEEAVAVGMADAVDSLEAVVTALNSSTTTGGLRMSESTKGAQAVTPDQITAEFLKQHCSAVHEAIRAEGHAAGTEEGLKAGAEQERARIKGIEECAVEGLEDYIAQAKYDPEATVDSVSRESLRRIRAGEVNRTSQLENEGELPLGAGGAPAKPDGTGGGGGGKKKAQLSSVTSIYARRRQAVSGANTAG